MSFSHGRFEETYSDLSERINEKNMTLEDLEGMRAEIHEIEESGEPIDSADLLIIKELQNSLVYKIRARLLRAAKEATSKEEFEYLFSIESRLPVLDGWEEVHKRLHDMCEKK